MVKIDVTWEVLRIGVDVRLKLIKLERDPTELLSIPRGTEGLGYEAMRERMINFAEKNEGKKTIKKSVYESEAKYAELQHELEESLSD